MKKNKIALFILVVLSCVAILFFVFVGSGKSFNSEKWKSWKETESSMSLRWDMKDDLVDNYNLVGMVKEEVIGLLGEPDYRTTFSVEYFLGMSGHGIDTGTLTLLLKNGKVASIQVRED